MDKPFTAGPIERKCSECGKTFTFTAMSRFDLYLNSVCPPCVQALAARSQQEQEERRVEKRMARWRAICPPLYRESDERRLPRDLIAAADAWEYGPSGLGFVGRTGLGKTRAMMMLAKRLVLEKDIGFTYLPLTQFSMSIANLGFEAGQYVEGLCSKDTLFLDDLGKGRLTESVQSSLFHIVETRTAHELPILFTSNSGTDQLAQMFSDDRAAPLLRRLGEFCEIIQL